MRIRWYGQSAFLIESGQTVFSDLFSSLDGLIERGLQFDYPPIEGAAADLRGPVTRA